MPEDRKYDYGYDGDGGPDNGNDGDLSEWIPVLIFLVCFPPVGVVLLVLVLGFFSAGFLRPARLPRTPGERGGPVGGAPGEGGGGPKPQTAVLGQTSPDNRPPPHPLSPISL